MKINEQRVLVILGIGWLLAGSLVQAQVSVELQLGQEQYLPGESMPVAVRITNLSGQVLQLGKDTDWLKFSIEAVDGFIVSKNGEAPVAGEFRVDTSKVATKRVDLAGACPESHHAAQNGRTCQPLLTRFQDDPFIKRFAFMSIGFADKDAKESAFLWKLHGYLQIQ